MRSDAAPDLDAFGHGRKRRHRHDGITHKPALGLPHGLEPAPLGVLGVLHPVTNRMGILKV
jgi:hypothetical protein